MNKGLAKFLVCSTVTLTGTMGLWLGISLSTWGQISVAQEVESSSLGYKINGRLDSNSETLNDGRYYDIHTFEGKAGEQLTINLVSEEFDSYLILFDFEGNIIAANDDIGSEQNAQIIVTLPQTGTYKIVATSNEVGELGKYVLSWGETTAKDLALVEAEELNQQVIELYQQGRYSEAIPLAEQALAIRREQLGNNHLSTATSLYNLGLIYHEQRKYPEAEPLYKQALAIFKKVLGDNHPDVATTLNNLAILYGQQGRYSEAEPLSKKALDIRKKVLGDNHPGVAQSLNDLARVYELQDRYSEAEPLYQEALDIRKQALGDNHPDVATSLNNLAELYRSQGRYHEAESCHQQALAIFKKALGDNHPHVATSLDNLGGVYHKQGEYSEAERHYQQALAIFKKALGDNHLDVATSLDNLGKLYVEQGRYPETEPLYQEALAIFKKALGDNHPDVATSLNNLAELYRSQGRYAEAESRHQEALVIRRKALGNNHSDVAQSLNNLGLVYHKQGRYPEAESLYQQALDIRKKALGHNHPDVAQTLENLATLYGLQKKYSEAKPFSQQALGISKKVLGENHPDVATSLNNLASFYALQGKYSKAEPLYQEALAIRKKALGDNHPYLANSLDNLAGLYLLQNDTTNAIKFLTQGLEVEEINLGKNLIAGSEQQKLDYIATISGTINIAISLNLQSATNNPDTTKIALTTILQRKGRILDFLTSSLQILRQQTDDPATQDLLTQLINLRTQYSNLIFRKPEEIESTATNIYRQQLIELETQTKQLEDQLSRRSAEFRNLSEPITLEKIQQLIPKNSALVELVRYQAINPQAPIGKKQSESRYAAYILRSEGQPQAVDLGEAEPIDKAVDELQKYLCTNTEPTSESINYCVESRPIAQVKSSAQKLEQMLMQQVLQLLGDTKNILLSPDSKLNLVPFEALVDENNQYLVENYNFTYLTSGRDLIRLQQKSPSEELSLVIADPLYNLEDNLVASNLPQRSIEDISELFNRNSFPRLAATEKEAQAIQLLLNLPTEQIKLQNQASETELKKVKSPQILHIATHGFFLDKPSKTKSRQGNTIQINDNPLFRSGLVLAGVESRTSEIKEGNNGVFTAYEATFLDLVGTKLVVLSACDTGVGDITTGEGIYGLRRALVIAGSESQLMSLWKVVDEGTKDLMEAYYQKLKQGSGRTNALHEVQKQMLRGELKGENDQSYQHPYYWASFIPSGDWTPMELANLGRK